MDDEGLWDHVMATEADFGDQLRNLADHHRCLGEVRGAGFFYAVDLCADRNEGMALSAAQEAGLQGGVLGGFIRQSCTTIRPDDRGYTGLSISPPLIADSAVIGDLGDRVDQIRTRVDDWLDHNH